MVGTTGGTWNKYLVNNYSTFKFKIVLSSIRNPDSWEPSISVYGDKELIFSASITKEQIEPIDVDLDISEYTYLRIVMDCMYMESYGYAASIVDARLEK